MFDGCHWPSLFVEVVSGVVVGCLVVWCVVVFLTWVDVGNDYVPLCENEVFFDGEFPCSFVRS